RRRPARRARHTRWARRAARSDPAARRLDRDSRGIGCARRRGPSARRRDPGSGEATDPAPPNREEEAMYSTVVVGADDSSTAREAVNVAADVAQAGGGKLHIVTAYDPKSVRVEQLPDELRYAVGEHPADVLLRRLSELVRERGLEPIVHAPAGDPVDATVG